MKSDTLTFSGNTLTVNGASKIETSQFSIQSGGQLNVSKSLEVTGDLVADKGSSVMMGIWPIPLPKPPGLIERRHDLRDYFQSEDAAKLYSEYYDIPLETIRRHFDHFFRTEQPILKNIDGILSATKEYGTTGADLVAMGIRIKPPKGPKGRDFLTALIAKSILMQSGSRLNFSFEKEYVPEIGDMFSLANVPIQIGENVHSNLASGWVLTNNATAAQYVGRSAR